MYEHSYATKCFCNSGASFMRFLTPVLYDSDHFLPNSWIKISLHMQCRKLNIIQREDFRYLKMLIFGANYIAESLLPCPYTESFFGQGLSHKLLVLVILILTNTSYQRYLGKLVKLPIITGSCTKFFITSNICYYSPRL